MWCARWQDHLQWEDHQGNAQGPKRMGCLGRYGPSRHQMKLKSNWAAFQEKHKNRVCQIWDIFKNIPIVIDRHLGLIRCDDHLDSDLHFLTACPGHQEGAEHACQWGNSPHQRPLLLSVFNRSDFMSELRFLFLRYSSSMKMTL